MMWSSWWSEEKSEEKGKSEGEGEKGESESGEKDEQKKEDNPWTKGLGVATGLFQSVTEYATTLSETVKKQVTETANSTFIGEFQKEQEKFTREQQRLKDASVPPWIGYNEEEQLKAQILEISADSRNVLREPPPKVEFPFEYSRIAPVAMVMLKEDPRLQKLRFELVPKKVSEEIFWRNYFYRVSLAKQSVQLSTLSSATSPTDIEPREQPQAESEKPAETKGEESVDSTKLTSEGDESVDEFISDQPYNTEQVTKETLHQELSQLGVVETGEKENVIDEGELWDELQAELQELDLEGETDNGLIVDWEQEMQDMLEDAG